MVERSRSQVGQVLAGGDGVDEWGQLRRKEPAAEDCETVGRGVEQAPVQPQLVFVGMEEGGERRGGVGFEPARDAGGKIADLALYRGRKTAIEPMLGEREGDCFQAPERGRVEGRPFIPEAGIAGVFVKEGGELVDMGGPQVAAQEMAQRVEGCVA